MDLINYAETTQTYINNIIDKLGGTLTPTDMATLEIMADTYELYQAAKSDVAENGLTNITSRGRIEINPSASIVLKCQSQLLSLAKDFGLTPKARKLIKTDNTTEASKITKFLESLND